MIRGPIPMMHHRRLRRPCSLGQMRFSKIRCKHSKLAVKRSLCNSGKISSDCKDKVNLGMEFCSLPDFA